MADEYIRKQDAFDAVEARIAELMTHPEFRRKHLDIDLSGVIRNISAIKPADAAPVVHSQWVLGGYDDMYYVCERCGHKQSEYYHKPTAKYCPNCGAKMDGDGDNDQ